MGDIPDYSIQPRPLVVDGAVSVYDLVEADLEELLQPGPVLDAARAGMRAREAFGVQKYGVALHVANGRSHLKDVDDEACDKVAYLKALMEQDPALGEYLAQDYRWSLITMCRIRALMADRELEESQS